MSVIVGTADKTLCSGYIDKLLLHKKKLCGVALQGLTDGSYESFNVPIADLDEIFDRIGGVLPKELLKIIEGCWDPSVILTAIKHGWDLFDGSYPTKLTELGYALNLNLDIATSVDTPYLLNLNDEIYKEDFNPILQSCECLACKKHTRAYIHHLLKTREMLANVLLSIHNLYHFDQFFVHVRRHISEKTFEEFKKHITLQCDAHEPVILVPKEAPGIGLSQTSTDNPHKEKNTMRDIPLGVTKESNDNITTKRRKNKKNKKYEMLLTENDCHTNSNGDDATIT